MAFLKAKSKQAYLKVGLYGPQGSGKTLTTLLVAEGIAQTIKKRVAYVDTERGTDFYAQDVAERAIHPAAFDFDACYTRSVTQVLKEVRALDPAIYGVLGLDSITHLWEATKNAYTGQRMNNGQIPIWAWSKLKKPYKDLMEFLINCPFHVLFCARQGAEFEEDETGEMRAAGKKMKAEGETAYEPHILVRMAGVKDPKTNMATITAIVEKDRTGILQGRHIEQPNFDNFARPLLGLLGIEQAQVDGEESTARQDAEALTQEQRERQEHSQRLLKDYEAKLQLAKTTKDVEKVSKEITPAVKKQMLPDHVSALRTLYQEASARCRAGA